MPLLRVLEPEIMDSATEAADYDAMDHADVNRRCVDDLLAAIQSLPLPVPTPTTNRKVCSPPLRQASTTTSNSFALSPSMPLSLSMKSACPLSRSDPVSPPSNNRPTGIGRGPRKLDLANEQCLAKLPI